jgi:hypothetical protein
LHEINQHACAAIKGIACSSIPSNVQVVFWYGDTHDDPNAFHFSIARRYVDPSPEPRDVMRPFPAELMRRFRRG